MTVVGQTRLIILGVVGGLCAMLAALVFVPSASAQTVSIEEDAESRQLLFDAIDAIAENDADWLAELQARVERGQVWLPQIGVDAIEERDAELLVIGTELLDKEYEGLLDMAYDYLEYERDLLIETRQGDADARIELEWADEEGASILEVMDRRGHEVTQATRVVLGPLTAAGGIQNASLSVYETALDDVDTDQSGMNPLVLVPVIAVALGLVGFVLARSRRSEAIANTDALTGLANRRRLESDIDAGKAPGQTAVLMIDVDHFKVFNDTHGHALGDEVLRRVGAALAASFRNDDVPYRYGGEEFCVLLPNTSPHDAMIAGERARAAIAAIDLPNDLRVTASVGVALAPGAPEIETIEAADQALYQAKHNGRNRVEISSPRTF